MSNENEIWIIDTSSIIKIRRDYAKKDQIIIYEKLTLLINDDRLVYPIQVYDELARGTNQKKIDNDLPFKFAKETKKHATRLGHQYETLAEILSHPEVSTIVDHEKVGVEEADPYILALAMHLKNNNMDVTVITEEKNDRPDKISMSSACGILKLYSVPIIPFVNNMNWLTK